jgi:hypothetical protein
MEFLPGALQRLDRINNYLEANPQYGLSAPYSVG